MLPKFMSADMYSNDFDLVILFVDGGEVFDE